MSVPTISDTIRHITIHGAATHTMHTTVGPTDTTEEAGLSIGQRLPIGPQWLLRTAEDLPRLSSQTTPTDPAFPRPQVPTNPSVAGPVANRWDPEDSEVQAQVLIPPAASIPPEDHPSVDPGALSAEDVEATQPSKRT